MPVALYLLLRSAAEDLQHRSLRENAEAITRYIGLDANGRLTLALPAKLEALFSDAYGRYGYSVLDAEGTTVFSSLGDGRRSRVLSDKNTNLFRTQARGGALKRSQHSLQGWRPEYMGSNISGYGTSRRPHRRHRPGVFRSRRVDYSPDPRFPPRNRCDHIPASAPAAARRIRACRENRSGKDRFAPAPRDYSERDQAARRHDQPGARPS